MCVMVTQKFELIGFYYAYSFLLVAHFQNWMKKFFILDNSNIEPRSKVMMEHSYIQKAEVTIYIRGCTRLGHPKLIESKRG